MIVSEPLHPAPQIDDPDDDVLDPYQIVKGVWQSKWIILAGVMTASLVAAGATLILPKVYSATATVVATPATFTTDLKPEPLSVEAYARLAESDLVRARLRTRLEEEQFFDEPAELELRTVLYSSREPQKPYLPLVGLISEWGSPEGAQKIANTWAAILIEEQERITTTTMEASVSFIAKEYPIAAAAVAQAEQELAETQARHAGDLARARIELGVEPNESRGVGVYLEPEGAGSLALKMREPELGPKRVTLAAQERVVAGLEGEVAKVRIETDSARSRVSQLEAELKRTPQYLDGALPSGGAAAEQGGRVLNPVYLTLAEQLATDRVRYNALVAAPESLARQLDAARATAASLRSDLIASERKMADLQRDQAVREVLVSRRLAEAVAKFKPLEEKIGNAQIAAAQKEPDLKLGALAPLPVYPIRPRLRTNVTIAAGIGLVLGLLAAWIVHRANAEAT